MLKAASDPTNILEIFFVFFNEKKIEILSFVKIELAHKLT